jgi:hypothetical protein
MLRAPIVYKKAGSSLVKQSTSAVRKHISRAFRVLEITMHDDGQNLIIFVGRPNLYPSANVAVTCDPTELLTEPIHESSSMLRRDPSSVFFV